MVLDQYNKRPEIIKISHHHIEAKQIDKAAKSIINQLTAAGFEAFIVGGFVRDSILGLKPKDCDVVTNAKEPISMETPIGDDEDSHLGDFIEDSTIIQPLDSATGGSLKDATQEVLAGLTAREAKVLRMRFGIDMNTDHTLEEVGKQFDVTRERIRQIEAKALRKLRHPSRSEQLRSFLDE